MKVILLKEVPGTGRKYEVKNVSDGFGRNFLVARGFAAVATPAMLAKMEKDRQKNEEIEAKNEKEFADALARLLNTKILIKGKSNEEGSLFASITKEMITEEVKKQSGIVILPESIQLEKPIKSVGEYTLGVVAGKSKNKGSFHLTVEGTK